MDGVELLLRHEEDTHEDGSPYSWEIMDESVANFTSDITPLILAAHRSEPREHIRLLRSVLKFVIFTDRTKQQCCQLAENYD